jgi:transposase
MKKNLVGIDISKSWLDVSICNRESHQITQIDRVNNDVKGINKLLKKLKKQFGRDNVWFCFEHTGHYGMLLCCILEEQELAYSVVSALEIKRSLGLTRGKNDKVDATRIAEYAAMKAHKLKASNLNRQELVEVKQLLTYRDQLVKIQTQFKNSIKSYQAMPKMLCMGDIIEDIQQKVNDLNKDIKVVEKKIEAIIKSVPELKENFDLSCSVKGIGLIITTNFLVITQNFKAFDNPRKLSCFIGTAPFEHSSGISKGQTKTSNLRHKKLKALMFNAVNTAIQHDPQLKNYYQRKKAEGKNKKAIKNAIACKLIYRVFAAIRRKTPYVVFAH